MAGSKASLTALLLLFLILVLHTCMDSVLGIGKDNSQMLRGSVHKNTFKMDPTESKQGQGFSPYYPIGIWWPPVTTCQQCINMPPNIPCNCN